MIYSPRAAPSVNKSHIPSLPKNNPYKDPLGFALCPPTHANFTITHLNYATSSAIKLEIFYENSFFESVPGIKKESQ